MLPDTIDCCPHCKSTNGYHYKVKVSYTQHKGFGNRDEDDSAKEDYSGDKRPPVCRCDVCGKIIQS